MMQKHILRLQVIRDIVRAYSEAMFTCHRRYGKSDICQQRQYEQLVIRAQTGTP